MYCKNCGKELNENAYACLNCGFARDTGDKFCANCGKEINPGAAICTSCGTPVKPVVVGAEQKSKLVTLLLIIFLGYAGIHDFYLGYNRNGVFKIILSVCTGGIGGSVWAFIDLIRLITGSLNTDANGVELKKEF